MSKKTLIQLYKQQYGYIPMLIKYDSIDQDINREEYWQLLEVSYKDLITRDLLKILHVARKDKSQISDMGDLPEQYNERFEKIINAVKNELATREHIPNKKERDAIRIQKIIDKKK